MGALKIIFIAVYLLALCCYFYTRTSGKLKYRTVNKYIMATMYLSYAIVNYLQNYEIASFRLIMIIALFFSFLGDLALVFDLKKGGDFFFSGNICFSVFYVALLSDSGFVFKDYFWVFIAWIALVLTFGLLAKKFPDVIKLGKMRLSMTAYLSSIFLHGMFGLACVILMPETPYLLMGIGSIMFMISDLILTVDRFIVTGKKWIVRLNSLFYFVGLLLIVLSIGL